MLHFLERRELLTYEEIGRITRIFAGMGIRKVRITGGEPLLRRNLERLIAMISNIDQISDIALTTNGFNFFEHGESLKGAGLKRVTISLDSLRRERFEEITRSRNYERVFQSLEQACQLNLQPVKVNCVLVRGVNDDEVVDFARLAQKYAIHVRFIEFMPLDEDEEWSRDRVVSGEEILRQLSRYFELIPLKVNDRSQTSRNFRFASGPGRIGLIMPVSQPFCGACSRIRLTADGKIRTCLFSVIEYDLRDRLRAGASDQEIAAHIEKVVWKKERGHRIDQPDFVTPSRSMSYIGG